MISLQGVITDRAIAERKCFFLLAGVLTVFSLWPVWWYRFLPMQDYPQHLFMAKVISTFNDPDYNWSQFYTINLRYLPYSLFYLLMRFFSHFVDVETAGKLFVSLYVLLVGAFVVREAADRKYQHVPWGILLLFPFSFHQFYYLGFVNYILSIPILFFVLRDFESFANEKLTLRNAIRHLVHLLVLFLSHPYTVLVYIVFSFGTVVHYHRSRRLLAGTAVVPPLIMAVVFATWYFLAVVPSNVEGTTGWPLRWINPGLGLYHYALMFTGMDWSDYGFLAVLILWSVVGFVLLGAKTMEGKRAWERQLPVAFLLRLAFLGYLALPFWMKCYSYFNLRLGPVTFFLLALLAAQKKIHRKAQILFVLALLILMIVPWRIHKGLSEETEEIVPLLGKMVANAKVYPQIIDGAPTTIEPNFFYQLHTHDHYYYHVLVGGGVNPMLFPSSLIPVQFREDVSLPPLMHDFRREFAVHYRYLLVRGAIEEGASVPEDVVRVAQSGKWTLFETLPDGAGDMERPFRIDLL